MSFLPEIFLNDVEDDDDLDNIVVVVEDPEAENLEEENILFVLDDSVPEDDNYYDVQRTPSADSVTDGTADDAPETVYEEDLDVAEVEEACAGIATSKKIYYKSVVSFLGVPLPV